MAEYPRTVPMPHPQAGGAIPIPRAFQQQPIHPQQTPQKPPSTIIVDPKVRWAGCSFKLLDSNSRKGWKGADQTLWSLSQPKIQAEAKRKFSGNVDVTPNAVTMDRLPSDARKRVEDWLDEKYDTEPETDIYEWTIALLKLKKGGLFSKEEILDVILKRTVRSEVKEAAERSDSRGPAPRRSHSLGDLRQPPGVRPGGPPLQQPIPHAYTAGMPPHGMPLHGMPHPSMAGQRPVPPIQTQMPAQFNHPPFHPGMFPPGQFMPNRPGPSAAQAQSMPQPRYPPQPSSPSGYSDETMEEDEDDRFPAGPGPIPRSGPTPIHPGFRPGPTGPIPIPPQQMPVRPGPFSFPHFQPQRPPQANQSMPQPRHVPHTAPNGKGPNIVHLSPKEDQKPRRKFEYGEPYSTDEESDATSADDASAVKTPETSSSLSEEAPTRGKHHRHSSSGSKNKMGDAAAYRQHRRREPSQAQVRPQPQAQAQSQPQPRARGRGSDDEEEYVLIPNKARRQRDATAEKQTAGNATYKMSGAVPRPGPEVPRVVPVTPHANIIREMQEDKRRREEIARAERERTHLTQTLHAMEMEKRMNQINELKRETERQATELRKAHYDRQMAEIERDLTENLRIEDKKRDQEREKDRERERERKQREREREREKERQEEKDKEDFELARQRERDRERRQERASYRRSSIYDRRPANERPIYRSPSERRQSFHSIYDDDADSDIGENVYRYDDENERRYRRERRSFPREHFADRFAPRRDVREARGGYYE